MPLSRNVTAFQSSCTKIVTDCKIFLQALFLSHSATRNASFQCFLFKSDYFPCSIKMMSMHEVPEYLTQRCRPAYCFPVQPECRCVFYCWHSPVSSWVIDCWPMNKYFHCVCVCVFRRMINYIYSGSLNERESSENFQKNNRQLKQKKNLYRSVKTNLKTAIQLLPSVLWLYSLRQAGSKAADVDNIHQATHQRWLTGPMLM